MGTVFQWIIVAVIIIVAVLFLFGRSKKGDCCDCPDKTCKKRRHG